VGVPAATTSTESGTTTGPVAPVVRVRNLVKRFGEVEAVRGIDLDVAPGEVFGFLGPNGAGKSTTIKILCTLAVPTSGTAEVAGHDVVRDRGAVRRDIGLVFQEPTLDGYLTADQNLRFHAALYGMPAALTQQRIDEVLAMVSLTERRADLVQTFSGGMKRRLEIARGLLHSPRVLFLDEPTIGLDPKTRASIWDYLNRLHDEHEVTVFVTTHYMDEAENCDRIAIINNGQIVAVDTPAALKAGIGKDRVQLTTDDDQAAITALRERFGLDAAVHNGKVTVSVEDGAAFVPALVTGLGMPIRSVEVSRPTLDDVFLAYTGSTLDDAERSGPGHSAFVSAMARRR
jgi:ABC-2 type transport system ATP-binding protein